VAPGINLVPHETNQQAEPEVKQEIKYQHNCITILSNKNR
jgi:hypothetical protein